MTLISYDTALAIIINHAFSVSKVSAILCVLGASVAKFSG
jgi:hypothetical protein